MNKKREVLSVVEDQRGSAEVASFFWAMMAMRGEMALASRNNTLDLYMRDHSGKLVPRRKSVITHDNLFDITSNALTLHQVLAKKEWTLLDEEMQVIWRMFVGQDDGRGMGEYSLAPEISGWELRRVISGKSRVEFVLRAGTPVAYVGSSDKGFLVQDLVPVPMTRDPFSVSLSSESRLIREYSPLVIVPRKVNEKHWSAVSQLAASFVDTVAAMAEPISVRMVGSDSGYRAPFDIRETYSLGRYLDEIEEGRVDPKQRMFVRTPERKSYWMERGTMKVEATFMNKKVVEESGIKISPRGSDGFEVDGVSNAGFLRDVLMLTVEGAFLSRLNETKKLAEEASLIFVEDLYRNNKVLLSQIDPERVLLFSELIYGTWVTGLLSLWRRQISDRVAKAVSF